MLLSISVLSCMHCVIHVALERNSLPFPLKLQGYSQFPLHRVLSPKPRGISRSMVAFFFGSNSSLCWIYIPFWRGLPLFPADVLSRTNTTLSPQVVCCHRHLAQYLCSSQTVAFPQLWLPAASWSPNFSSRFYILFGKTFLFLFQAFLAASGERFLVSLFLFWGQGFKARAVLPSRGRGARGSLSLHSD